MPVKVFGKKYKSHDSAARAAKKKKGIRDPDAYVASVERKQRKGKGGKKKK